MQDPAVRTVGCVACDQRLPLRSLAARLRGSEVVVESGANSKRQPELRSQQWLRNVKGAGSATGDMLYNIAGQNSGTKPWRRQRVHRWRPRITYPLISLQAQRQQGQQEKQRRTQGCGCCEVCCRLERVCAHQFDSGLVFWYGQWFAGSLGGWSYFGAQQTCGPDYTGTGVSRPL